METSIYNLLPDEFIIFDTEFTSWKNSIKNNWKNKNEYKELVQIGALKVKKTKKTLKIVDKLNIYIKPEINPILSDYFKNLTGISQSIIEKKGISFLEGMKLFYRFCKNNKNEKLTLFSNGNDFDILKYNLNLHKVSKYSKFYKWEKCFKDIALFFSFMGKSLSKYSSGTLYRAFNIKVKNPKPHDALWDSKSLFLSLKYLI